MRNLPQKCIDTSEKEKQISNFVILSNCDDTLLQYDIFPQISLSSWLLHQHLLKDVDHCINLGHKKLELNIHRRNYKDSYSYCDTRCNAIVEVSMSKVSN